MNTVKCTCRGCAASTCNAIKGDKDARCAREQTGTDLGLLAAGWRQVVRQGWVCPGCAGEYFKSDVGEK